jgi:AcrR family transcriptional regulator
MDFTELETRKRMVDAAITLFTTDKSRFSIRNIAVAAEVSTAKVYEYYTSKDQILNDFYNLIPLLCKEQLRHIEGYDDLPLADRLSHFIYTSFDLLQEQRLFTEKTLEKWSCTNRTSLWKERTADHIRDIIDMDSRVSDLNRVIIPDLGYSIAASSYMQLIRFWLHDTSEGSEKTLALVEKSMVFVQEIFYADVLSKGLDLGRYVYAHVLPDHPWAKKINHYLKNCKK